MDSFLLNLVIQLVAGAVGGNAAGAILKQFNLGPLGNSIAGIIGGGLGGQLLNMILAGSAFVGHHDRIGLRDDAPAKSWNASHPSRGCSKDDLPKSGGNGLFYCFAAN